MPLPSSGPIKMSEIRDAMGLTPTSPSGTSLREYSRLAKAATGLSKFDSPDVMSEFYSYSAPATPTPAPTFAPTPPPTPAPTAPPPPTPAPTPAPTPPPTPAPTPPPTPAPTNPPLSVTISAITCVGANGYFDSTFSGGSGVYSFAAIGTSESNAIQAVNGVIGKRIPLSGETSVSWGPVSNGNSWVAVRDSAGNNGISSTITINCTTPPPTPAPTPPPTPPPTPAPTPPVFAGRIHTSQPSGFLACSGGTNITLYGNNADFCSVTTWTSDSFTSLGTSTFWLSYGGNYVQIFHMSGNTATRSQACQACTDSTPAPTPAPTAPPTPPPTAPPTPPPTPAPTAPPTPPPTAPPTPPPTPAPTAAPPTPELIYLTAAGTLADACSAANGFYGYYIPAGESWLYGVTSIWSDSSGTPAYSGWYTDGGQTTVRYWNGTSITSIQRCDGGGVIEL